MELNRNHYQILGVPATATPQQVIGRYRELARMFHPDIACGDKGFAQMVFQEINVAYSTLRNAERRKAYDAELFRFAPAPEAPKPTETAPAGKKLMTVTEAMASAQFAYAMHNFGEAEELCRRVLRVDANNAAAHRLLGDIHMDRGARYEALQQYRAAVVAGDKSVLLQEKIKSLSGSARS